MEGTSNQSICQHDGNKNKIYYNCNWHILFENYYLKICVPKTMTKFKYILEAVLNFYRQVASYL